MLLLPIGALLLMERGQTHDAVFGAVPALGSARAAFW